MHEGKRMDMRMSHAVITIVIMFDQTGREASVASPILSTP